MISLNLVLLLLLVNFVSWFRVELMYIFLIINTRLVIIAKSFFKLPKLQVLIKQKSLSLPEVIRNPHYHFLVFSTKVNLLYLPYLATWMCYLLHLIKQSCLLKSFLENLILMTQVSLYLFLLLELI